MVPNNLPLPEADTRQALLELSRAYTQLTACVAVIIAGGGFWASAIRGSTVNQGPKLGSHTTSAPA